jgi:hypothetical protein
MTENYLIADIKISTSISLLFDVSTVLSGEHLLTSVHVTWKAEDRKTTDIKSIMQEGLQR